MKNKLAVVTLVAIATMLISTGSAVGQGPDQETGGPQGQVQVEAVEAAVNSRISYQGVLKESGRPVTGLRNMVFSLFADGACTGAALQSVTKNGVQVTNGLFAVKLDVNPDHFNGQGLWLQVRIGATNLGCEEIAPVPYALSLRPGARVSGGDPTLALDTPGDHALRLEDAHVGARVSGTNYGIAIMDANNDGFIVESANEDGFDVNAAGDNGLEIMQSGSFGIYVDHSNQDAIRVSRAGAPSTTTPSPAADINGLEIEGAQGDGIWVGRADDSGVRIENAGNFGALVSWANNDGIRITDASDDAIQVGIGDPSTNYGMYVPSPGTTYTTLLVETASSNGEWALYSSDKIHAGNVLANSYSTVGVVAGQSPLAAGDLVATAGLGEALVDGAGPVLAVQLADDDQRQGVIGVVVSRMELVPAPGKSEQDGPVPLVLQSVPGPASAGDLVDIVIFGMAQVKVDAQAAISAGQRLTVAEQPGSARPIKTVAVEGIQVAESAPVIGVALEDKAGGNSSLWVLVNPQ